MSGPTLRPYQRRAVDFFKDHVLTGASNIICAPVGTGLTIIWLTTLAERGGGILFVTSHVVLADQARHIAHWLDVKDFTAVVTSRRPVDFSDKSAENVVLCASLSPRQIDRFTNDALVLGKTVIRPKS